MPSCSRRGIRKSGLPSRPPRPRSGSRPGRGRGRAAAACQGGPAHSHLATDGAMGQLGVKPTGPTGRRQLKAGSAPAPWRPHLPPWQDYPTNKPTRLPPHSRFLIAMPRWSAAAKGNTAHSRRAMIWWQQHHAKNLYAAIGRCERVFVIACEAVLNMAIAKVQSRNIFDQTPVVCMDPRYSHFSCISSMTHEIWMRLSCSSIGGHHEKSPLPRLEKSAGLGNPSPGLTFSW